MSDNKFSRHRRGMRFRPKGGLGPMKQKQDREASQARADVVSEQGGNERLFEKRHTQEIERAENIAAGLPPEGTEPARLDPVLQENKEFREPHPEIPPVVEEKFEPVTIKERPAGVIEAIKTVATNIVKKVQRFIRPVKKIH